MSKHTNGPWHAVDCRHQKNGQIRVLADGKRADARQYGQIANVLARGPNPDADARLIAEAPALLDALKGLLWMVQRDLQWDVEQPYQRLVDAALLDAHEAIARAEGRA